MDLKNAMKSLTFFCFLFALTISYSQSVKTIDRCATDEYNHQLMEKFPEMKLQREALEKKISKSILEQGRAQGNRRIVYTIPVVVHVIHSGEAIGVGPNISDAQVLSQIKVLNEDFRRMAGTRGFNTNPVGADVEVEFCLVKQTPDGCTTNGINRIDMSATSTSWGGSSRSSNTNAILKPATMWDPSKYLNMWTVNFSDSSLLGFAQFPGGSGTTDGVVMGYQYFGSDDDPNVDLSGSSPFHLGRTTTHEVGHYFGLYHTFQGGCLETAGGDLCADTPPVASSGSNSGVCNPGNDSCSLPAGSPDMVENYMDYSSDACMNVFTNDQKARMIATITTASNRPTILTSNGCNPLTPVSDDASVSVEQISTSDCSPSVTPTVRVTNWGTSTMTSATITYDVDGGTSSNYNWSGSLAEGEYELVALSSLTEPSGSHTFNVSVSSPNGNSDLRSCNNSSSSSFDVSQSFASTTQVHLTLVTDDYGGETTWEFRDSSNTLLYSGGPLLDNTTYNESFDVVADECYTFTILDSANDGICCGFGNGSYELRDDDSTLIVSGASFTDSESTNISTLTLGANEYFRNNRVRIYPNPVNSELTVKLANGNDLPDSYEVYNLLGQVILKKDVEHISDLKLNVSSVNNGMYFIKIFKEGSAVSLPFIKR
jgi:hypothetical protein